MQINIMRIAIITDTHYRPDMESTCGVRQTARGAQLLRQAIMRLNQNIKPDLTVLLGDLIDAGHLEQGESDLREIYAQARLCQSPLLAIPGNHDGSPEQFYRVFPRPEPVFELMGLRFVCNVDPERPGYNASREPEGLALLAQARAGFEGPIVSLQHVPVLPPGTEKCPYNYDNAAEILQAYAKHGVCASISGHYHAGLAPISQGGCTFLTVPALCEAPFRFMLLEVDPQGALCSSLLALEC